MVEKSGRIGRKYAPRLDSIRYKIMDYIRSYPGAQSVAISAALGISNSSCTGTLSHLYAEKAVLRTDIAQPYTYWSPDNPHAPVNAHFITHHERAGVTTPKVEKTPEKAPEKQSEPSVVKVVLKTPSSKKTAEIPQAAHAEPLMCLPAFNTKRIEALLREMATEVVSACLPMLVREIEAGLQAGVEQAVEQAVWRAKKAMGEIKLPREKHGKVLIVGLLSHQEKLIEKEFGDCFKLSFIGTDAMPRAEASMKHAVNVIGMVGFMNHQMDGILKKHEHYTRVSGGMDSLREKLTQLYLDGNQK